MKPMNRDELLALLRSSNITFKTVDAAFDHFILPDASRWKKFIQVVLLTLGIGFAAAGIVFFFAYNWNAIGNAPKLITTQLLIAVPVYLSFLSRFSDTTRKALLSTASIMIGVFFAVYGQIYQTGANAYEFFMAWSIFSTAWVLLNRFLPLWTVYSGINFLWLYFYMNQTSFVVPTDLRYLAYLLLFILAFLLPRFVFKTEIKRWYTVTIAMACASVVTTGITYLVFGELDNRSLLFLVVSLIAYVLGVRYSLSNRDITFVSIIALSMVVLLHVVCIKIISEDSMDSIVVMSIISPLSIILSLVQLNKLKKKWRDENG